MKNTFRITTACMIALTLSSLFASSCVQAQQMPAEYQQVLETLGKKGDFKDNVLKVNIPRNDLTVTVDGVPTPTPFGFGGWIAMTHGSGGHDVMMGDLVLLQEEVNPVMSALLDNGLEVTALHNHFFFEQPRIFYMHVHGMGTPADLAREVKPALDLIGHVSPHGTTGLLGNNRQAANRYYRRPFTGGKRTRIIGRAQTGLDTARLSRIIGHPGEQTGQVYKITIGRSDLKIREMGALINARMGLNTWAAFVGTNDNAAIAGDIAMLQNEVTPVLKALRRNGLDVVAIHHHMLDTRPMIIFLHYWGTGPAEKLATGFKAALEQLGKGPRMGSNQEERQEGYRRLERVSGWNRQLFLYLPIL